MKALTTNQLLDIRLALRDKAMNYREIAGRLPSDDETRAFFSRREAELLALAEHIAEISTNIYSSASMRVRVYCRL